jgi:hypothetical protein
MPQSFFVLVILEIGSCCFLKKLLNWGGPELQSSYFSFPPFIAGMTGVHHHTQFFGFFSIKMEVSQLFATTGLKL